MPRVVVIGGGPGGSVTAARLRQRGLDVVVFEKTTFPRFHLGESLLPKSLPVLETIGVLAKAEARFLLKYGARFHDDVRARKDRFSFDGAWKPEPDHAFQVPRDDFDALLLDHAKELGADVRMETKVDRVVFEGARAIGVSVAGALERADFVVDASGRDLLTGRAATDKIEGLDQTAIYAHFTDVPRAEGALAGDIDIVLFESGEPERPNWFWFIPFADGRTSVGAVVSRAWMRARAGTSTDDLFAAAARESSSATELLARAKRLWPRCEATADFSYRVRTTAGPGWLAVGDAGGFIDPLFSTGAHLAMTGGLLAADTIADTLAAPADEGALVEAWRAKVRAAAETFILAVQAFYRGPLVETLFAEDKHAALRRSITSLLAGDVYGDSVWLRDIRVRLREMVSP
ncbi:MAG: tryptophan 7-halogenase [Labilithrix sp.]|nr:tryptophan 7-halogenase [Labilithrix sp.]MCW5809544.1 tryptophan 7-halogenase [Labilithrix sp.]